MSDSSIWELVLCGLAIVCGVGIYIEELVDVIRRLDK